MTSKKHGVSDELFVNDVTRFSDEQRNRKLSELLGNFWAFHEDRQSLRRLKDASSAEVQKMLDEGIVQPSESPWSSPVVLSLLKSGVEFHWGPEEVEAFNSLKKAALRIQYWGCTTKELLQKSILMQAGTVSELS
ncbi:hypothetical protein TNCV_8271 [Trichonephila clavipes]|nr:hypothetical protein TNCV_8271 [Trichonephila clavipes]